MEYGIDALNRYFSIEIARLSETYSWKIGKINGFGRNGQSSYEANVELKFFLNTLWKSSDLKGRESLAKTVVSDWGGIRGNLTDTLNKYVFEADSKTPRLPLKGVASYSKILSIADPKKYAIFDARVAACLNAVQIKHNVIKGLAFHYLPSRNTVITGSKGKPGFTRLRAHSLENLADGGWELINGESCYPRYLEVLRTCLSTLAPIYRLYDLEMILFANAVKECRIAMSLTGNKSIESLAQ